ncbi:MAG: DUF4129 domain-containing protein [Dehalococcoidia bacterium]|nr:MAG: DUF4129 domain-containing protein [Dehalococcoidia bacterium]
MQTVRQLRNVAGRDWLERGLLPLVVLAAEVGWFYPWLVWLGKLPLFSGQRVALAPVSVMVLLGGAFLVTRFFLRRRWPPGRGAFGVVCTGLLVILLVLRGEYGAGYGILNGQWFGFISRNLLGLVSEGSFAYLQPVVVALAAAFYLWWRGIRWGRSIFAFEEIYRAFVTGAAALVLLGVAWFLSSVYRDLGNMLAAVGIWVIGFFFFGLVSLALGNFQVIRQKMAGLEEATSLFNRRWLGLLFLIVIGIVLAGAGLASLFSADTAAVLGRWLGLAGDGLLWIVYYVLIVPVSYLVAGLVYAGQFLVSLLGGGELTQVSTNVTDNITQSENITAIEGDPAALPPAVLLTLKWVILAAAALVVVYLLARAVARARPSRAKDEVEEVHESLWSWALFRGDLSLVWQALRRRFARKRPAMVTVLPELPGYKEDEAIPDYPDIRAIYRRLLWEGEVAGVGRRAGETPAEYAGRLERAVSGGREELGFITEQYQRARYGEEVPEPPGILAQANRLFHGFCGRLRALRNNAGV